MTTITKRKTGFDILKDSVTEAALWAFIAHLVFNTWHRIFPVEGWDHGYSVVGLVGWLISSVLPENWVPALLLILAMIVLVILGWKFGPMIRSCVQTPWFTAISAGVVFGLTLGVFEVIYFGVNGTLFFSSNLILNTLPPLVVATIILGSQSGRIKRALTGTYETVQVEDHDEPDADPV